MSWTSVQHHLVVTGSWLKACSSGLSSGQRNMTDLRPYIPLRTVTSGTIRQGLQNLTNMNSLQTSACTCKFTACIVPQPLGSHDRPLGTCICHKTTCFFTPGRFDTPEPSCHPWKLPWSCKPASAAEQLPVALAFQRENTRNRKTTQTRPHLLMHAAFCSWSG